MFKAIFGSMTKFRVISYFILLAVIIVLNRVVSNSNKDFVECFYPLVAMAFWFECCTPVDESKARNKKRK